MAYILDGLELPRPRIFNRRQLETGATIQMLDGSTKKDIINRKEQYTLSFLRLTATEVENIIEKYNLQTALDFSITESNLTVASTSVHMEINDRSYNVLGNEYREDITLILTEVS